MRTSTIFSPDISADAGEGPPVWRYSGGFTQRVESDSSSGQSEVSLLLEEYYNTSKCIQSQGFFRRKGKIIYYCQRVNFIKTLSKCRSHLLYDIVGSITYLLLHILKQKILRQKSIFVNPTLYLPRHNEIIKYFGLTLKSFWDS